MALLKYSFSEATQRKGVTLVEVGSEGVTQIAHHPLLPRRDVRVLEGELAQLPSQITMGTSPPSLADRLALSHQQQAAVGLREE